MKAGNKAKEAKEDGGETKKAEAAIEKAAKAYSTNWNTLRVLTISSQFQ